MKNLFIILLSCILLTTVLNASQAPIWMQNPYKIYDQTKYICGVGSATDIENAKMQALADISRYFEAQVSSSTLTQESETTKVKNNRADTQTLSSYEAQVKVFSDVKLEFAILDDSWQDPDTKLIWVLMLLDKDKLRPKYRERIAANETALQNYLSNDGNPFAKVAALSKAEKLLSELEHDCNFYNALADNLSFLVRPSISSSELESLISEAKAAVKFKIVINDDLKDDFLPKIQSSIQKMGFTQSDISDLELKLNVSAGEVKNLGKQVFVSYDAELYITLASETIFMVKDSSKQGDLDQLSAKNRSLKALANSLAKKFERQMEKLLSEDA